jgi:exosortase/archaeosortase family protein
MGIMALAFVYLILVRRVWWERALLVLSIIPVALISNSTRIVVTALLYQYVSGEAAHKFTHDLAGWVMIPFAACLFALVLWYLDSLIREEEQVDVGTILRQERIIV